MKTKHLLTTIIFGILLFPQGFYAQVDFNQRPTDDLGIVEDQFQEYFFEAIKQKGIENYQKSVDALLKCIELDDEKPVLFYELGKNYMQLKNFGAAEDAFKEAVSQDPDNEWFLDELYGAYLQQGEMKKALKTVRQLVEFHPDYKQDLASLYIRLEKYNDALKLLDEMDKELGYSEDRDYLRNQIYNLTGDDEERIENLEERIKTNPEDESTYLRLIFRYSETGETKKAFEAAKRLEQLNPDSQLVHLALYKFYLDAKDTEKAISSMKIVLTSPVIKPEAKTKVLNDFVKFVSANPQYESDLIEITSLVSEEKSVRTLTELGQYNLKTGDKQKALTYYEEALKREPKDFSIIKDVMLLNIDLKNFERAEKLSSEAIELFPAQPILYLANGVANINLNRPKIAAENLETGVDYVIDDDNMLRDFYEQLSQAYKLLDNIKKSETFAKKAQALSNGQ
ncbi:MAG: tetratricopeptide repeat protein [Bacteroidota bacterium]